MAFPHLLAAWGNTGHEAVACIAWQRMTPESRARAMALIRLVPELRDPQGSRTIPGYREWLAQLPSGISADERDLDLFMIAATWADSIEHQWLRDSDTPPSGIASDVNIGFSDPASHGYWHFVDEGFSPEGSVAPPASVPNAATQITAFRNAVASRDPDLLKAYDLIWLEHLAGDLHQPLHAAERYAGGKGDAEGNSVTVRLDAPVAKAFHETPRNLHSFWDDLPGQEAAASGFDAARRFAAGLDEPSESELNNTDVSSWANDSFLLARRDAYRLPAGNEIASDYYEMALRDAKIQIALAGARLAKLLNENLQ
ncbi:MAG: S1/P1 nuclease [Acidobacteriota bacterium]|nr:S1/P1 nuclease [Acidobacteriota bacterium]